MLPANCLQNKIAENDANLDEMFMTMMSKYPHFTKVFSWVYF